MAQRLLFDAIEILKEEGLTATQAFEKYAEDNGLRKASVQAMYYQQRKAMLPAEPESLASRLRALVAEVDDMEKLLRAYQAIR